MSQPPEYATLVEEVAYDLLLLSTVLQVFPAKAVPISNHERVGCPVQALFVTPLTRAGLPMLN